MEGDHPGDDHYCKACDRQLEAEDVGGESGKTRCTQTPSMLIVPRRVGSEKLAQFLVNFQLLLCGFDGDGQSCARVLVMNAIIMASWIRLKMMKGSRLAFLQWRRGGVNRRRRP